MNGIEIGKRIKERRNELNMTLEQLATILGFNKSTMQRYESGKISKIKLPVIQAIATALKVNPEWLVLKTDVKINSFDNSLTPYNPIIHKIPVLGQISAGLPLYAEDHIDGYTYTTLNGGAEYFALRVKGDSMNAVRINDSDMIIVRRQPEVKNGEIAVVIINKEDATVKRFKKDGNTVQLIPQSFNPEHQIQIYDLKTTDIEIIGKVVECKVEF